MQLFNVQLLFNFKGAECHKLVDWDMVTKDDAMGEVRASAPRTGAAPPHPTPAPRLRTRTVAAPPHSAPGRREVAVQPRMTHASPGHTLEHSPGPWGAFASTEDTHFSQMRDLISESLLAARALPRAGGVSESDSEHSHA